MIVENDILFEVNNLTKIFKKSLFFSPAPTVDNVSLTIKKGKTLGLVGRSGSGKSTFGRMLIRLIEPTAGRVFYKDIDMFKLSRKQFAPFRRDLQMVFQNPLSSFDRLFTISETLSEGLRLYNICDRAYESDMIDYLLQLVGLDPSIKYKYPTEISGGECQRVSIARSLSVNPEFIVFDEPTTALDMIVADKIIETIKEIQKKTKITYLFISHNIGLVKQLSDEIAVMESGKIVEIGAASEILNNPGSNVTKSLISAFRS